MTEPVADLDRPCFPEDVLPPDLAVEMQAVAACCALPTEVTTIAALTVFSAAVGNAVRVLTPMGSRSVALQVMVIAPAQREAREGLALIVDAYVRCIAHLRRNSNDLEPIDDAGELEHEIEMSPATKRLVEETGRKAAALHALELICPAVAPDAIEGCLENSFDRAVLVDGVNAGPLPDAAKARQVSDVFTSSCEDRLHDATGRAVCLSHLGLNPAEQVSAWCRCAVSPPPWILLDGRTGQFGTVRLSEKLLCPELCHRLTRVLLNRVRKKPRVMALSPECLPHLNRVVGVLQRKTAGLDGRTMQLLAPTITTFHRLAALFSLLENVEATSATPGNTEKAARLMAWLIDNQIGVARDLSVPGTALTPGKAEPDRKADQERILQRLREGGTQSRRNLQRRLPKRGEDYWTRLLADLAGALKIIITRAGRSEMVSLVPESPAPGAPENAGAGADAAGPADATESRFGVPDA